MTLRERDAEQCERRADRSPADLLAPVSCGYCAGRLDYVNGAGGESERVAVCRCEACGREWMVLVQLRLLVSAEGRRRAVLRARERVAA